VRDCCKKKSNCTQAEGSGGNQCGSTVKTANLIDFSTMTTEQKDNMLIEDMQSKAFLEKDDDEKLDWVAKIAPKGF